MFVHVIFTLIFVIPCVRCFLDGYKDHFVHENFTVDDLIDCTTLNAEQYYLQIPDTNSSVAHKLNCLPKSLQKDKYFPKCCPPNHFYHRKHHKCVEVNNATNIYDSFRDETLLIRTALINCTVVLDHILEDASSLDITSDRSLNLKDRIYSLGSYCLEGVLDEENLVVRTCEDADFCKSNEMRCIKKCCPDGQHYTAERKCSPGNHGLSLEQNTRFVENREYFDAIMVSGHCSRYIGNENYHYRILEDGTTEVREQGIWHRYTIDETYYCMEFVEKTNKYEILLCVIYNEHSSTSTLRGVLLIISSICLGLTVIGYLIVPRLKNFMGKIIIIYCSCLLLAFILLTWLQFKPNPGDLCSAFAFAIGFFFLTAFTWMTVLSYEIGRFFRSMEVQKKQPFSTHLKRFLWYNLFAWSIPIILTTITFLDYTRNIFPKSIRISLASRSCVYENNSRGMYGYVFQFALPCGILLLINTLIFIKTIMHISKVKPHIGTKGLIFKKQKKWKAFGVHKQNLFLALRISSVMGVGWLFETVSSILVLYISEESKIVEIIPYNINALRGW